LENLEIMNELFDAYSGKRVFVTGHTGFKGSWLIKILNDLGAIVMGYSLEPEKKLICLMKSREMSYANL
jgi:CDP-glucose 4,6-dehydratase